MMELNISVRQKDFWGQKDYFTSSINVSRETVDDTMKLVKKGLKKLSDDYFNFLQVSVNEENAVEYRGYKYKFLVITQEGENLGTDIYNVFARDIVNGSDEYVLSKRELNKIIKAMAMNECEGLQSPSGKERN